MPLKSAAVELKASSTPIAARMSLSSIVERWLNKGSLRSTLTGWSERINEFQFS